MAKRPLLADINVITDDLTHLLLDAAPPAGRPGVTLMPGLRLEQVPDAEAELYIEACQERGLNHDGGKRHFKQLYSFARLHAPESAVFTFDSDRVVERALQLSRLIVLNSHCTEWGVRVLRGYFPAAKNPQLAPARCHRRFFAFRVITGERHWLTQKDAKALGRLMRRYAEVKDALPERVTNGMWMAEWGARIPYIQPALVNLVTSLEALLKTDRHPLKTQFVTRTCALAEELGVDGVTDEDADALYEARSDTVHGGFVPIENNSPEARRLVPFQKLLMKALRRAIEDNEFCGRFESDDSCPGFLAARLNGMRTCVRDFAGERVQPVPTGARPAEPAGRLVTSGGDPEGGARGRPFALAARAGSAAVAVPDGRTQVARAALRRGAVDR